ncbi:hypothetical protein [Chitinophaga sp.]|uniref:hypothetical protein n=1 Tax=Chitinophaga sp. TaxID=1869181 RepID=UPI0026366088|nr:hypothetical protein [uncultured Chitinophaga sp.]
MKKLVVPAAAVVLLAASCSTKNEVPENPEQPKETWYLNGWTYNGTYGGSTHYRYQVHYNPDSTVKQVDEFDGPLESSVMDYQHAMTYDNGQITALKYGDPGTILEDDRRFYYKDGKLVRIDHLKGQFSMTDSLYYNGSGNLTSNLRVHAGGSRMLDEIITENGNVMEVKKYDLNGGGKTLRATIRFKYDLLKMNPFKSVLKADYFFLVQSYVDLQWEYSAKNQPVYRTLEHAGSPGILDTMHFYFKYNDRQLLDSIRILDIERSGGLDRIVYENLYGLRYSKKQ